METIKGILQDRDRPVGSSHCGAENCGHWNHNPNAKPKNKKGKK